MHILGIITARGGSKRIPNKNIKILNNKPLICFTLEAAEKSKLLTKAILSSDNYKILNIAKKFKKIEIPFIRPEYLSRDNTPSYPVIKHAVQRYEKLFSKPDIIVLLQPTSPFRKGHHIDRAIKKFLKSRTDSLVSINKTTYKPELKYFLYNYKNNLKSVKKNLKTNSKKFKNIFVRNGAIYIFTYDCLKNYRSLYGNTITGYIMNSDDSIDINNYKDWEKARKILAKGN
mgnify:FL=1|tara:strand:+ start:3896 stop:4585 length:690 start_codon:yes stop_codon:yes gene_type:complete